MLPFTWAVAERRFHQGLLIRFGQTRWDRQRHPRAVHIGGSATLRRSGPENRRGDDCRAGHFGRGGCGGGLRRHHCRNGGSRPANRRLDKAELLHHTVFLHTTGPDLDDVSYHNQSKRRHEPHAIVSLAIWPAVGGLSFLLRSSVLLTEVAVDMRVPGTETVARSPSSGGGLMITVLSHPLAGIWYRYRRPSRGCAFTARTATSAMHPSTVHFLPPTAGVLVDARRTRPVRGWGSGWPQFTGLDRACGRPDSGDRRILAHRAAAQCGWLAFRALGHPPIKRRLIPLQSCRSRRLH